MRFVKILQPVLIVLVVYAIFTVFLLNYYEGDISCLVHAGEFYTVSTETPPVLCLKDEGFGYDGQFNYRFALDPFSNEPVSNGIILDWPAYRYQRIFYPFLTWALSAGNRVLVPYLFVLINLFSTLALTAILARYALDQGRNSHWSLLIGLYPGFLISYALDLGHALEILFLCAVIFLVQRKDGLAVVALICAILNRETALVMAIAILIVALIKKWQQRYLYLLPVAVFLAWWIFVKWFWQGVPDIFPQTNNAGFPFSGIIAALTIGWQNRDAFAIVLLVIIAIIGFTTLFSLRSTSASGYIKLAWLFATAMIVVMPYAVWGKFNGYLRGLSEWYFLSYLVVIPMIRLPGWIRPRTTVLSKKVSLEEIH